MKIIRFIFYEIMIPLFLRVLGFFIKEDIPKSNNIVDDVFDGFIGNDGAVALIKRVIKYYHQYGSRKLQNIALFGQKSTGKTELYKRIAKSIKIKSVILNRSSLSNEKEFLKTLESYGYYDNHKLIINPILVFIDEVHTLPRKIQDALLTALEPDDGILRIKDVIIDCSNISWVVATTDPGKLTDAFRSRFVIINLQTYSLDEIVQMMRVRNMKELNNISNALDHHSYVLIAKAARFVPRQAIAILKQICIAISVGEIGLNYHDIKKDINKIIGCDEDGLTHEDYRYLNYLFENGTSGIDSISRFLGTDKNNIESIVEPYLMQLNLIKTSSKGRQLTDLGKQLIFIKKENITNV